MNTSDFNESDPSDFEKQLKSLAPRESTVHRDDLLFRAGYEAGIAAKSKEANVSQEVVSVPLMKTTFDPWIQSVAVAVLILVGLICGAIGWQVGEQRTVARYEALPNLMNQLTTSPKVIKPNKGGANLSIAKSSEPLPPVYATDDPLKESFTSSNEPNYIELRDQVLRFGVDAMPESYSFAAPVKSSKERKVLTPLSYGSVMELSSERF